MARPFSELAKHVRSDPARRKRVAAYKQQLLAGQSLSDLRATRGVTQAEVAQALRTTQPGISRLEHQSDLCVSTLRNYVEALGGHLEINGVSSDGRVPIDAAATVTAGDDEDTSTADAPSPDQAHPSSTRSR